MTYNIYRNRIKGIYAIFISLAAVVILFAAAGYSYAISADEEVAIGAEVDKEISNIYDYYTDERLNKYVTSVGERVLGAVSEKGFKYHFKIVKSSDINAFALPGGYVYVTTGILSVFNSEAELAGVLGHEIGHVTAQHAIKQQRKAMLGMIALIGSVAASATSKGMQNNTGELFIIASTLMNQVMLGYSREYEMESDRLGLVYASSAGYDPRELVYFLKGLKFQEMLEGRAFHSFAATHPDTKDRVMTAEDFSNSLANRGGRLEVLKDVYIDNIAGLMYGGQRDKKDVKGELKKRFLDIYTAKEGDTVKSIVTKLNINKDDIFRIAVINNKKEETPLKEGEKIKIIVDKKEKKDAGGKIKEVE